MATDCIRFILDGREIALAGVRATTSLLDWLRNDAGLTATREGCAEGDCGACTVVIAEPDGAGRLRWSAVNACLQWLPMVHGRAVYTIAALRSPQGELHPVQQALLEAHASQCGFCTPGFAMALFALYQTRAAIDDDTLIAALGGNLCRCTGYRPLRTAAERLHARPPPAHLPPPLWHPGERSVEAAVLQGLAAIDAAGMLALESGSGRFLAPHTLKEFDRARAELPQAKLVAGGTDLQPWLGQIAPGAAQVLHLGRIRALSRIDEDDTTLTLGAAVSLSDAFTAMLQHYPEAAPTLSRFGSRPIRNAGTLCGNLARASPVGDAIPLLIALGARLQLRQAGQVREIALEDFYLPGGRTELLTGELVQAVRIPLRPGPGFHLRSWKVSRRHDQDIATLSAGFVLQVAGGIVVRARLAYGGLAARAHRASRAEAALLGRPFDAAALAEARRALAVDFQPLSDLRANAAYRLQVARNLLTRLQLEMQPDAAQRVLTLDQLALPASRPPRPEDEAAAGLAAPAATTSVIGAPVTHESARLHVTGTAPYTDDLPEPRGTLHAMPGLSDCAHARLLGIELEAVRAAPGVVAVLTAADIPGCNDFGAVEHDDPILAEGEIRFHGQPLFLVIATDRDAARRARALARVNRQLLPAVLTVDDALTAGSRVLPDTRMRRGEPEAAIAAAPHRLSGCVRCGGQEHYYLEGQVAFALPQEDGTMKVLASTQHPGEVQFQVAGALGVQAKDVAVECRRMGGGFGGKECQPGQIAALAALAARHTGKPVKLRLERSDDMTMTGKRHDFRIDYEVGFDDEGRILGLIVRHALRAGHSADLSGAIADRALLHADNAYYLPNVQVDSLRLRTNTVSNTAFRGFGGPQGMFGIEEVIDMIARTLARDPLEVRKLNSYAASSRPEQGRDLTPYGQRLTDNILPDLAAALEASCDYPARRAALNAWNAANPVIKRGLALTPVKFGISFTATHLNQAGALLQVYADGSVLLNHGGTEMGQGLLTRVAQIVAEELQLDLDRIRVSAADTAKVPNASATAASTGTDLNGKAAQLAARRIRTRLARFAAARHGLSAADIHFERNRIRLGSTPDAPSLSFAELAHAAWMARIPLSATGFYRPPGIHFDREHFNGHPFRYFVYGAACTEVAIDTLTGELKVLRADLLQDVGQSLNPALDRGQIEGGYMQGLGWLTMEELVWDGTGRLLTCTPATYKIPTLADLPADFRVALWSQGTQADTLHHAKALGEPPLMLALSVWHAIKDAIAATVPATAPATVVPQLNAPATAEEILRCLSALRLGWPSLAPRSPAA